MKITRKKLRQIIRETVSQSQPISESANPDAAARNPAAHDWERYPDRTNMMRQWICMSGIPGGWGEEQWGFMKLQGNKVIRYGNPGGEIRIARIQRLSAEGDRLLDKSFSNEEVKLHGMMRIGEELFVSGQILSDIIGFRGWKGTDPGSYKRIDEPLADEAIRKLLTDLYARGSCRLELTRLDVPVVGDVDVTLVVG